MGYRLSVAREAARLLYNGMAEEYIQAKEMAASSLGVKATPSNYEVALELDRLADELEGGERQRRLTEMRTTALEVMTTLRNYNPRLIGSVWRGTARQGSDIDIVALSDYPVRIEAVLSSYRIREKEEVIFKGGVHAYHFKLDWAMTRWRSSSDPPQNTLRRDATYTGTSKGASPSLSWKGF